MSGLGTLGNDDAIAASISASGDVVAFTSDASNLVGGDTNGAVDLFVRNTVTGVVNRIAQVIPSEPRISPNSRYVSYRNSAGLLAVYDRSTAVTTTWSPAVVGFGPVIPIVPDDGSVAISGVMSSFGITSTDCRVRNLSTGLEQTCPPGGPGFGQVTFEAASPNGRYVLYYWLDQSGGGTSARLLWDRSLNTTTIVPGTVAFFPTLVVLADDGTIVYTDVQSSGLGLIATYRVPTATLTFMPGAVPNGATAPTGVSADGSVVTFVSLGSNVVPGDTNGSIDVFRWDVTAGSLTRTSVDLSNGGELPNGANDCGSAPGQVTSNGQRACGLTVDPAVPADTNGFTDGYRFG